MRLPISTTLVERAGNKTVLAGAHLATSATFLAGRIGNTRGTTRIATGIGGVFFRRQNDSGGRLECYALVAAQTLQGLMLLNLAGRGRGANKALIVDYLATNPANRNPASGLKWVGLSLLAVAIMRSLGCGMKGRIWLESLPAAETFYLSSGFTSQGRLLRGGLIVFTLSESGAEELLEEMKRRGIIKP